MSTSKWIKCGKTVIRENLKHKKTKELVVEEFSHNDQLILRKFVCGEISIKLSRFCQKSQTETVVKIQHA